MFTGLFRVGVGGLSVWDKIFDNGRLWEGKWRRGDVLNSPLIHCTPVLHCLLRTLCTLSWYSLSLWGWLYTLHNGGGRPHHWTSLVSSLHLQAVETYRDWLVTSLTRKQTGINTFGVCCTLRSWFHACLGQSPCNWRTTKHWNFILKMLHKPWNTLLLWKLVGTLFQYFIKLQSRGEAPK